MGSSSSSSKYSTAESKPSDFRHNAATCGIMEKMMYQWLVILLSEWLDIKDVSKLDTAMTNHALRAAFLQLLASIRSSTVNGCYDSNSFTKLHWLSLRQICVESVELDLFKVEQLNSLKLVSLQKLVLRVVGYQHVISATALLSVLQGCQMLKTVALEYNTFKYFTATEIKSLQPFGHLFTTLNFPNRCSFDDKLYDPPSKGRLKAFAHLIARCPNLKKMRLQNMGKSKYKHEGKDDSALVSLGKHCLLVEEIELVWTARCPDAGLKLLSQNCTHLRMIEFDECYGLTDASLLHISRIHSLQELRLSDCDTVTNVGLQLLFRGCPNMKSFSISGEHFTEQAFRGLTNAPFLQNLTKVWLWFYNMDLTPAFEVVVGECLSCCHNLVTLSVRYYADVSFGDAGLAMMCEGCPKLEILTLVHGETLTIDGLMHAASTCPLLREIDIEIFGEHNEDLPFSRTDLRKFEKRFPNIQLNEAVY